MVRLASTEQSQDWLTVLHSKPSCKQPPAMQVKALRPGNEVCEEAHNLLDPMRTSLLLLGKAKLGPGFHVDRTQAENIAFSVATKPQGKAKLSKASSHQLSILARWWFVHPYMTTTFNQFVTNDFGRPEGIAGFRPSVEHFDAMYAFGDRHMVDGRSSVLAVLQGPGDIVQVPPGWPHAVTNLELRLGIV
ncbi:TPA: hypothetical protein ACH3X1_004250 [Trebouxia sp. C0004]